MPVSECEVNGSPSFTFGEDGLFTCQRRVQIAWSDLNTYCEELIPYSSVVGNVLVRDPPSVCPYLTTLRVKRFTFMPYFGERDLMTTTTIPVTYNHALFTIDYATPTAPQDDESANGRDPVPFLEHRVTSGGQLLSLDQDDAESRWKWYVAGDAVPVDMQIPKMIGTTQHSVHWPMVPSPHWPNLENFKGHVNSEDFILRGYPYIAQSLLYLNYDMTETVMTNRTRAYNLTLHFEGKLVRNHAKAVADGWDEYGGHNHYWNKEWNAWDVVCYPSGGDSPTAFEEDDPRPYPTADFHQLFRCQ